MKDYVSKTCKCGFEVIIPYPSMQRNPPKAPLLEEVKIIDKIVLEEFIHHQNKARHAGL